MIKILNNRQCSVGRNNFEAELNGGLWEISLRSLVVATASLESEADGFVKFLNNHCDSQKSIRQALIEYRNADPDYQALSQKIVRQYWKGQNEICILAIENIGSFNLASFYSWNEVVREEFPDIELEEISLAILVGNVHKCYMVLVIRVPLDYDIPEGYLEIDVLPEMYF